VFLLEVPVGGRRFASHAYAASQAHVLLWPLVARTGGEFYNAEKFLMVAVAAFGIAFTVQPAAAGPEVGAVGIVKMVRPLTGPGVAVCVAAGTLLHEGVQAANGKPAFGKNGEGARAFRSLCRGLGWKKC